MKVIIFGASEGGKKVYQQISKDYKVIAFSDNDVNKHNSTIKNIPVISPEDILNIKFDSIIIGSTYELEISQQLVEMGIDKSKIESGWCFIIGTPSNFPWDAVFFLVSLLIVFAISVLFIYS